MSILENQKLIQCQAKVSVYLKHATYFTFLLF